jgi:hypothetical protein
MPQAIALSGRCVETVRQICTGVQAVPYSCPKRPKSASWSYAAFRIRNSREASNHRVLRAFARIDTKPLAPPYKQEVAGSSPAPPTDREPLKDAIHHPFGADNASVPFGGFVPICAQSAPRMRASIR